MRFKSVPDQPDEHHGLGIVVANQNGLIAVMWDHGCDRPFVVYKIETLNPKVISRFV